MSKSKTNRKSIVFFHPDLGIGGAERLIIDAAVGLQSRGHKVTVFTSHCDPRHCFDEARDGTLDVRVRGALIPPSLRSRFTILLTSLRQLLLILTITFNRELSDLHPDVFILDQLSYNVPLLRFLWPKPRVLFYCHFPDQLLAQGRSKWWKRVWRLPFDWAEGYGMRGCEKVVVNSKFTRSVVRQVFGDLDVGEIGVVYPCVPADVEGMVVCDDAAKRERGGLWKGKKAILSINRFERKKDIELAIKAFAGLPETARQKSRLVIAGGYDPRIPENVQYHAYLVSLCDSLSLPHATFTSPITALSTSVPASTQILFLLSIPSSLKTTLLRSASLLVYTPSFEHFGIVPVEAMQAGVPVLACNTGGPLETVVDGETGWLRDPNDVRAWTDVMATATGLLLSTDGPRNDDSLAEMGRRGQERARRDFSEARMAETLDGVVRELCERHDGDRGRDGQLRDLLLFGVGVAGALVLAVAVCVACVRYRQ